MAFVILSAFANSTAGLLVRSIEAASDWQIVAYRGLALAGGVAVLLILQHRSRVLSEVRRIGRWGVLGGVFYGVTATAYTLALTHTTVANTVFTLSAIPFFTAVLARILLGERVRPGTWAAMAVAFAGIALITSDGIAAGTLLGNMMALVAALAFSCFVIVLRHGRAANMLPATGLGALLAALVAAIVVGWELAVSSRDLAILFVWGGLVSCLAHSLVVFAARHMPGAELTLLFLIEFVLAPLWVWFYVAETPGPATLAGGAVVLAAAAGRALTDLRPARRP